MPSNGADNSRDLCSDKCLLKFAKERNGIAPKPKTQRASTSKIFGLSEFLDSKGIKPSAKGAVSARHARLRHEMGVPDEECLVCEFLTNKEVV
jgi:hypothetical protein